jgi:hypothetical protein
MALVINERQPGKGIYTLQFTIYDIRSFLLGKNQYHDDEKKKENENGYNR